MTKIPIGVRLGIAFGFLISILLGVGWIGLYRMGRVNSDLNQVFDRNWAKVQLAQDAAYLISLNNRITMDIFLSGDRKGVPQLLAKRAENMKKVAEDLKGIQADVQSPMEAEVLSRIVGGRAPYLDGYNEALNLLMTQKDPEKAREIVSTVTMPMLSKYRDNWNELVHLEESQMAQARDRSEAHYAETRRLTILLILLGTFVAAWIAVFATRKLMEEISEREQAKLEIRKLNESLEWKVSERTLQLGRLAAVVESSGDAIIRATVEGTVLSWNAAAERLYGYTAAEMVGKQAGLLVPEDRRGEIRDLLYRLKRADKTERIETAGLRNDGRQFPVAMTLSSVRDFSGNIDGIAAIVRDITETKRMEEALRQAQKMEAVGRLAGGVAHDFNNLLNVILGYSELLLDRLTDPEQRKQAEQVLNGGKRASALTRQLLAFSRQQVLETKVLNLNSIIKDMTTMLPRLLGEDIEVVTDLDRELGNVSADQSQIEQVIMNLAVNARDAMPDGGKLVIKTSNAEVGQDYAQQHPPMVAGNYVKMVVSDTGTGMDAETQGHIFEPFFTTKPRDKGTGLGLAMVYGVVKQSGGYIWVRSEAGKGSAFIIYLPRVEKMISQNAPPKRVTGRAAWETILLVEDEASLRTLARTFLEQDGYRVLEAESGVRAIEMATQRQGPIHLLLTDMVMPGMNGIGLAERLTALRPSIRVVYMTGYAGFTAPRLAHSSDAIVLTKPFTREGLLRKIHEVLEHELSLTS